MSGPSDRTPPADVAGAANTRMPIGQLAANEANRSGGAVSDQASRLLTASLELATVRTFTDRTDEAMRNIHLGTPEDPEWLSFLRNESEPSGAGTTQPVSLPASPTNASLAPEDQTAAGEVTSGTSNRAILGSDTQTDGVQEIELSLTVPTNFAEPQDITGPAPATAFQPTLLAGSSGTLAPDAPDVNEVATDIALSNATLDENDAGARIGSLTTTDPDAGDSHTYTVSDARFEVTPDGTLKLRDGVALDFETEQEVNVTVTATDTGGLARSETFSIDVQDDGNLAPTLDLNVASLTPPGQNDVPTMTFGNEQVSNSGQTEATHGAGNGETAVWSNVGIFQGVAFDVRATIVSESGNQAFFDTHNGNSVFKISDGEAEVRYEFLRAGTDEEFLINGSFLIDDIDGGGDWHEGLSINIDEVDVYGTEAGGDLAESLNGDILSFQGETSTNSGDSDNAVAFNMYATSEFTVTYEAATTSLRFFHLNGSWSDGYFDNAVVTDTNANHADVYTEGSTGVSVVSENVSVGDPDGTIIEGATIILTNAHHQDALEVGGLPSGITSEVDHSVPGQIIVTLSGSGSHADYETALQAVTFANGSEVPNTDPRVIEITVTDGDLHSTTAESTIHFNDLAPDAGNIRTGSNGADLLIGDAQGDLIEGNGGADLIYAGGGEDMVRGGDGADTVFAGDGDDKVYGGNNDDRLFGGDGNDQLFGDDGSDTIFGGAGNDTIEGGFGTDQMDGGDGVDTISFAQSFGTASESVELDLEAGTAALHTFGGTPVETATNFENAIGSSGDDILRGSSTANTLQGGAGDDSLDGRAGDDVLAGGDGNDTFVGGTGDDVMFGGEGDDLFTFQVNEGTDAVFGGGGGWTDVIAIDGLSMDTFGEDWTVTLDSGSIDTTDANNIFLSGNASGFIDIQEGGRIEFHDIAQIQT